MAEIVLVRQEASPIPPADADAARRVLFGLVDGLGESNRKRWRRFVNGLFRLEPGEMAEIRTNRPRSGPFHRRHMALEQRVFEAQERFEQFKPFRDWLKVGAGHCDWFPGPKGGVFPVPKSIAYDQLEEDEMREFHDNTVAFLRTEHAGRTLWKHLGDAARVEMVESVLQEFGE
jgi:Protein of unknown function (DUF1367).